MKTFLVVVSLWSMAYRGDQKTPSFVQEMPSYAACMAVGNAFKSMSNVDFRCVKNP